jgi:8-oxo-dGTP pyrophosphatase MutT (NUDIX family)
MPDPWPTLRTEPLGDFRIFSLRRDFKRSPRTGAELDFFVLDCPGWVNVVAVTPDDQLVCVEQFRHGSGTIELEIPGGVMDPHDRDPVATGLRELREETGYEGGGARVIGSVWANPAIQTNTVHTVLVENCRLRHATEPDRGEDLATRLVPAADIPALVASGKFKHSLVVVALFHFQLLREAERA